jgi:hypothetical protein
MCAAIEKTLGAISSGTVYSRVGACDPRGLFAKPVLRGDPDRFFAVVSLSYPSRKIRSLCGRPPRKLKAKPSAHGFPMPNGYGNAPTNLVGARPSTK